MASKQACKRLTHSLLEVASFNALSPRFIFSIVAVTKLGFLYKP